MMLAERHLRNHSEIVTNGWVENVQLTSDSYLFVRATYCELKVRSNFYYLRPNGVWGNKVYFFYPVTEMRDALKKFKKEGKEEEW